MSNTTGAYISIDCALATELILGESSTVTGCVVWEKGPPQLVISATGKSNLIISNNTTGGWSGSIDTMSISVTGGSNQTITGNSSNSYWISVKNVPSGIISGNYDLLEDLEPTNRDSGIRANNSSVDITGNYWANIYINEGYPDVHNNNYSKMTIDYTDSDTITIHGNNITSGQGMIAYMFGADFNLGSNTLCRFIDNDADIYETLIYFSEPIFLCNNGKVLIEDCDLTFNVGDPSDSRFDVLCINGGTVDMGGGGLGSSGRNTFGTIEWNPSRPSYLIMNQISENTYALNNTWDTETTDEMNGNYYDTANINKLYDKWEDPSKGFVIWSEPDPNGPIPAFSLLAPTDNDNVTDTPTLDWQDMSDCPWITFGHFDLHIDTSPSFSNPDVYPNLTQSEYTFTSPLGDGETYYWKVKIFDTSSNERWSNQTDWSFVVESGELGDFSLLSPSSGATVNTVRPTLDWEDAQPTKWGSRAKSTLSPVNNKRSLSLDKQINIKKIKGKSITLDHYELYVDTDSSYGSPEIIDSITESTFTFDYDLDEEETYYWKIKAVDSLDRELWCNELDWWFFVDIPAGIKSASLGEIKASFVDALPTNSKGMNRIKK